MFAFTYQGYIKEDFTFKKFYFYVNSILNFFEIGDLKILYNSDFFNNNSIFYDSSSSNKEIAINSHRTDYSNIIQEVLEEDELLKNISSVAFIAKKATYCKRFEIKFDWCNHVAGESYHNKKYDIITFYIKDRDNPYRNIDNVLLLLEKLCVNAMDLIQFRKLEAPYMPNLEYFISYSNPLHWVDFSSIKVLERRTWKNARKHTA